MTYVVKVKHGALGEIVVDVTTDLTFAHWISDDIAGSWVEVITDEGTVQE